MQKTYLIGRAVVLSGGRHALVEKQTATRILVCYLKDDQECRRWLKLDGQWSASNHGSPRITMTSFREPRNWQPGETWSPCFCPLSGPATAGEHQEALDIDWIKSNIILDLDDEAQAAQFGKWFEVMWSITPPHRRQSTYADLLRYMLDTDHMIARAEDREADALGREWDVAALAARQVAALVPLYSPTWYQDRPVDTRPGLFAVISAKL